MTTSVLSSQAVDADGQQAVSARLPLRVVESGQETDQQNDIAAIDDRANGSGALPGVGQQRPRRAGLPGW
nr:hypothetical protein [Gordonia rubripertincta]